MTIGKWFKMYQAYKDVFDTELILTANKTRYSDLEKEITIDDVIPL